MPRGSSSGLRRLLRREADRLRRQRPRSTILLFGSRARGEARAASDYDVAIILPNPNPLEEVIRARRARLRGLRVDVVVLGVRQLEDPMYAQMLDGAVVLHDGLNLFMGARRVSAGPDSSANRDESLRASMALYSGFRVDIRRRGRLPDARRPALRGRASAASRG